jgi:RNA polymerase sigma-70 factor (ECF subfamily)
MAFTEIDEKLLVRAYQAGDERAFDTIVRTQYNALFAHALRRLSQHEAAEDAVQDTLLRAYRALPNLDGDLALRAWLHRILTNVCHDEGNRRNRAQGLVEKVAALPEELAADPVDEAVLHDTVRVMSEALKDLPESYREALVLRYVDGLSFREVAEVTGVTEENARARVHRGRVALHKLLSRVSVMLAFIIPGLRRAPAPTAPTTAVTADQAVASSGLGDHTLSLATQLTSHVVSSAPAMSRFAELSAAMPGGKSALAAAAVTAVAAISVPVAVHTAHDATKTERPPAAVAAPSPERLRDGLTTTTTAKGGAVAAGSTTSSTLPPSQTNPFATPLVLEGVPTVGSRPSDTTTTSPTSTTTPVDQGPMVEGHLAGNTLTVTGTAPQWDVDGPVSLVTGGRTTSGTIVGRVYVYDDGSAESDALTVSLGGRTFELRYRGKVTDSTTTDSVTTYRITGVYVFTDAARLGLAERGDVKVVLALGGERSTLSFDLRGRSGS